MKKVVSIVGARPQFIKLAPLSVRFQEKLKNVIVHTGQHYDRNMSEMFFKDLQLNLPKYDLGIGSGNNGIQTGNMLISLEKVLLKEKPDLVTVFGDTNSTLAGALSATKMGIPLLHIEAGLRSYNREMPEEINRVVTDHISDYLFTPTETAMKNLEIEGLVKGSFLTGDIMVDALKGNLEKAKKLSKILEIIKIKKNDYFLLTLHRPYNVDIPEKLGKIIDLLGRVNKKVVFPIHPRTKKMIDNFNIIVPENIILTDPLGYLDFICLENYSNKIITDSGGIQKEAYILKKPCITIRSETEWVETINDGWNVLVQPDSDNFVETISSFEPSHGQSDIFGNNVAEKMIQLIEKVILK